MFALSCPVLAANKISEEAAVAQLKKATASQLDPALPTRSFGAWVSEKFGGWDVQWEMHDCGSNATIAAIPDSAKDVPVCVQVNIMQPSQDIHGDASNGFHVLFQVGTQKKGLMAPKLRAAVRKDGDEVEHLANLAEVEP
jgi:hypothetical protein